ncbi:Enoyl-CoA hydratase/isomerase family [Aspergillus sclerotialis]|uniref:Enoyl-CoA hydratase domain-containing protein 3, mitochondrial n=1 Tax=Aspergillus sclerotialis TaxID=2070753 RepID=A0A3A2ZM78_9EURO|nr:Enoyl-CoA hydratase/isomerase family [Aspergillus sclerotialis]
MPLPQLPAKAAYLHLNNPARRNALSLPVLRDLHSQLTTRLTSPKSGRLLLLPPFQPSVLDQLESSDNNLSWLTDSSEWAQERANLPNVIVLRSEGPVFSSGHDLKALAGASHDEVKETFSICAEVMSLIRRSPAIVVCPIQGMATAAGFQLAMTTDFPIALAGTKFCLPGMRIGLPCTSPSTAVARRVPSPLAYRLFATAETVTAEQLHGAVDVVSVSENVQEDGAAAITAFENRVSDVVQTLAERTPGQPQAIGKWAFWTQQSIGQSGGDSYGDAAKWAGRAMALHAKSSDAKEGISAFLEKRRSTWKT